MLHVMPGCCLISAATQSIQLHFPILSKDKMAPNMNSCCCSDPQLNILGVTPCVQWCVNNGISRDKWIASSRMSRSKHYLYHWRVGVVQTAYHGRRWSPHAAHNKMWMQPWCSCWCQGVVTRAKTRQNVNSESDFTSDVMTCASSWYNLHR